MKKSFPIFVFLSILLFYSCKKDDSSSSKVHQLVYQLKVDTVFTTNVMSNFHYIWKNVGDFTEDAAFLNSIHPGTNNSVVKVVTTDDFISLYAASNMTNKFTLNLLIDGQIVQTSPVPTLDPNITGSPYTTNLTYIVR